MPGVPSLYSWNFPYGKVSIQKINTTSPEKQKKGNLSPGNLKICINISPRGPGLLLLAFWFVCSLEDCDEKDMPPAGFAGASLEDELILMSPAPSSLS